MSEPADETGTSERLRKRAIQAMARRDYARMELRRRLLHNCADADLVDCVLDEFIERGLLCDYRFAASFTRHRVGQGYGPVRIRAELEQRGADPAAIETALAEADVDWAQRADQVRRKKFGAGTPTDYRARARQAQFLHYRGFASEHISGMLD